MAIRSSLAARKIRNQGIKKPRTVRKRIQLLLCSARRWRKWVINYRAIADPGKLIPVRPCEITHKTRNDFVLRPGDILGGNWDIQTKEYHSIIKFKSIIQHFEEGIPWEDTDIFRLIYTKRLEKNKLVLGASSIEELAERYRQRIDPLFDDMKRNGFVVKYDNDGNCLTDIPHVNIGRNGEILYGTRGNHRLGIAKILGLEQIWCHVRARHADWQKVREVIHEYGPEQCWSVLDSKLAVHPDLQDLLQPETTETGDAHVGTSRTPHVLLLLKHIPDFVKENKADMIASFLRSHELAGVDITLGSVGRISGRSPCNCFSAALTDAQSHEIKLLAKSSFNLDPAEWRMRKHAENVAKQLESRPVDAIVAYCTSDKPALLAQHASQLLKVPYIVVEHRAYETRFHHIDDLDPTYLKALHHASGVYAVSPLLRDSMVRLGVRDDVQVLPNCVSESFFAPPSDRDKVQIDESLTLPHDRFIFAGWTRWREFKRVDLLVDAFLRLRKQYSGTHLVVAGKIESENQLEYVQERIADENASEHVHLTGPVDRNAIHRLAHGCDCCVISSQLESFGLAALEAHAAGKPVVATRCFGPEFIIRDERLGRVVEPNDPQALCNAMIDVYENYTTFDAHYIQRQACDRFSERVLARKLRSVYKNLCAPSKVAE